jgi:hypothetical protein
VRKICNATSDEHIVDRVWWFNIIDASSADENIYWFSVHLRAGVLALVYVILLKIRNSKRATK